MRIVSRAELMSLPAGTLYCEFQSSSFSGLYVKGETLLGQEGQPSDWLYQSLDANLETESDCDYSDKLDRMEDERIDVPLDFDCLARDGSFAHQQLYAVYSAEDMVGLISRLVEAYTDMTGVFSRKDYYRQALRDNRFPDSAWLDVYQSLPEFYRDQTRNRLT